MLEKDHERKLCIALGNELLSDDGLPYRILKHLEIAFIGVDFLHVTYVDAGILCEIEGYHQLLLIDTMITNYFSPGAMVFFDVEHKQPSNHLYNYHDFSFYENVAMGRQAGMELPEDIAVIAIEIVENKNFKQGFSRAIRDKEKHLLHNAERYAKCFFRCRK